MKIRVFSTPEDLGAAAAEQAAGVINGAIEERGSARIVLSTGASQFPFFDALGTYPIDWARVEAFHLDEYIGLSESHPASFRKYLRERFDSVFRPGKMHYVSGEGDVAANIAALSAEVLKAPIDLGMIGIGENGHLAFNDPPADFDTEAVYHVVTLNEACKAQQVREGWFPTPADVPAAAISMTIRQIMKCKAIISVVPHAVKAYAVREAVRQAVNSMLPATVLKQHGEATLCLDEASAAGLTGEELAAYDW
ncbi:MAG: 6-phosphogluconolactonase [Oscillospiraceae bacterium]|nr:6-phosphogluconolactonase [Oscillospiraceae bacterium]